MLAFGIEHVEWKTSDANIPFPHCKILSAVAASGAEFSATSALTDFNQNIPTAAISRIACRPRARVAHFVVIPGSSTDWAGRLGANFFRLAGTPDGSCYSVTTAQHQWGTLSDLIDPGAQYDPANSAWDYIVGLHAITQNTTAMMAALFFDPMEVASDHRLNGCVGISGGVVLGFQPMDDWRGLACDGMVLIVGGDGFVALTDLRRSICANDGRIPLTNLFISTVGCATNIANQIGLYDKAFRQRVLEVLSTQGESAAFALAVSYDLSAAPSSARQLASRLMPTGALGRPTIIVQGTSDLSVPAILSLSYMERVLAANAQDLARFYLAAGLDHDAAVAGTAAAVQMLLDWMNGIAPRDLVFNVPGLGTQTVKHSRDAGFENDPCGYYDFTVGSHVCSESGLFVRR